MGTVWSRSPQGDWSAEVIDPLALGRTLPESRPFHLVPFGQGTDRNVALLMPADIQAWVNGEKVISGIKVLGDRDEILVGGATWYYSSEQQPQLIAFRLAPGQRTPRCGVCRMAIDDGDLSVTCPRCGRVYHQLDGEEDRPAKHCFTYKDRCLCGHPTSLAGEAVWRPGEEDDRD